MGREVSKFDLMALPEAVLKWISSKIAEAHTADSEEMVIPDASTELEVKRAKIAQLRHKIELRKRGRQNQELLAKGNQEII
jgi:hypothetical protein